MEWEGADDASLPLHRTVTTPRPVRIGLVGYGFGGRYFHTPLIEGAPGCELAGVVVRSEPRRTELAQERPDLAVYADLAGLAAAGVDAVVVTTPLDSHVALVLEAVALGVPVVCDKPFAPDASTARTAVDAAERAGVLLSIYQNRRWDADFLTVQDVVGSGVLGEVSFFESRMEQRLPPGGLPRTGGGALRDLGSHAVDQALTLFGPVRSVYAEVRVLSEDGFDDRFFVALEHAGGVRSHVTGSWTSQGEVLPRFRVTGSAATCLLPDDDGQTERLLDGRTPAGERTAWGTVPESRWGTLHRDGATETVPARAGSWTTFYAELARALRGEAPPPVDPRDAVAALEVLDAARLSASSGQVVDLLVRSADPRRS
jgi:predicted dehydrogenase